MTPPKAPALRVRGLSHVTHAVRDLAAAKGLYQRVFAATPFFEGLLPVQRRQAALLLINDLCVELLDAPPAVRAEPYVTKHGGRFYALTLQVPDVEEAAARLAERGIGAMERRGHHLVADPATTHGVRFEFTDADLPGDPRLEPGWTRKAPPGASRVPVDGLWSLSLLMDDVAAADLFFKEVLGAREVGMLIQGEHSKRSVFYAVGNARISSMQPKDEESELARVLETQGLGIHGVGLTTQDPQGAGRFLRGQGLGLLGSAQTRYTVHPSSFLGARYLFMQRPSPDNPHYIWRDPVSPSESKGPS